MEKDFFYQNDENVTQNMVKVLRWLIIAFPAIMLFSAIGLFQSKISDLLVMTAIGVVVTMGPTVAYKMGTPIHALKYITCIALCALLTIMASNASIGIYMTYSLPMVCSIFYYDKKFTIKIASISYVFLVLSLYLRSLGVAQIEYEDNFTWFVSRSVGFLIETVVMAVICAKIAEGARKLLVNLNDTTNVAKLVAECNDASVKLLEETVGFKENIGSFRQTNAEISDAAAKSLEDCETNGNFAVQLYEETDDMKNNMEHISSQSSRMTEIAEQTSQKLSQYISYMNDTASSMEKLRNTAEETENSIKSLQDAVDDVAQFTQAIEGIASQTNLLALNASIEAARAGDMGKGFAVVADEVRALADNSRQASSSMNEKIENMIQLLSQVQDANANNMEAAREGLTQINRASDEAAQIGSLQADSKEIAKQVFEACEETQKVGIELRNMAQEMQTLVGGLREQTEQVVEQSISQREVTGDVEAAFVSVETVAQKLVEIARM